MQGCKHLAISVRVTSILYITIYQYNTVDHSATRGNYCPGVYLIVFIVKSLINTVTIMLSHAKKQLCWKITA